MSAGIRSAFRFVARCVARTFTARRRSATCSRAPAARAIMSVLALCALAAAPARADIGVSATSEQGAYVRGQTNTFVFHLALYSTVFETADNIHLRFPAGVKVSAARYVDGFNTCPDALLLVLGMGTNDGGWFNPGHPSGCGYFYTSVDGEPQTFSVDADIPADYTGDLPVLISVEGDQCCDPPPHDASVTLTFADAGSPALWNFDDAVAPALPAGWSTAASQGGIAWTTVTDAADSAPNAAHAPAGPRRGETLLTSASVLVAPGGGELRFRQRFATDAGHDGGVLEIAIDGGAFEDIVAAGGAFRAGGYNGAIGASPGCAGGNANPLLGRMAWSGVQADYGTVAVTLPAAASAHRAQFRWRLGTDCVTDAIDPGGWWIDDVRLVAAAPAATIGPDKLVFALGAGARRVETLHVGNGGGSELGYRVTFAAADADCAHPSVVPWLGTTSAPDLVAGGGRVDVPIEIDSASLAGTAGTAALICVATSDPARLVVTIPVTLLVTPSACLALDRIFADAFDPALESFAAPVVDPCNGSLRTFASRDAFLTEVADGYFENRFTGLRSGPLHGPIVFGNGTFAASVFTQDNPLNPSLHLFPGSGVLSRSAADQVTLTFTGAPVTALGGDFYGALFSLNQRPFVAATTIVLTLDDGSSETFRAGRGETFRGFIATRPIRTLSIASPDIDENGDVPWGVVDNLVVGSAR